MKATVLNLTRRGHTKTLETQRCARARKAAQEALDGLFDGLDAHAAQRMADAALDIAVAVHAAHHGPDVTAPRLSKTSGLIYPATSPREDKFAKADAQLRKVG